MQTDDETVVPPAPADAPQDHGAGSEPTLASVPPAEAPDQHQAESTSAASTEVVDLAAIDPPTKAAPAIVRDQWTEMAKGVQETLRRDLEKIKRLDELLSRPIFSTPHVAPPDHPSLD